MRPIPIEILYPFLKNEEGELLRVYDDQAPKRQVKPGYVPIGTLTAGIGHTGHDVKPGMVVTSAQSREWLENDLKIARTRLYNVLGAAIIDELTKYQYAALLSFCFNLGANPKWTIWKVLRAKQFDQVPAQMMQFTKARVGGKLVKMTGLVKRRTAEINLWHEDEPGIVDDAPKSTITSEIETPPIPADPVPPAKSASVITAAVGAVAAVPAAATQVTQALEPYADKSDWVNQAVAIVASVAAAAAVLVLVLTWLHKSRGRK